jgi:AcrR family transcriptional regulator
MAKLQTEEIIRMAAKHLFARFGYDGVSMRILAKESGVGLSSIYHFFDDKDILLKAVYEDTNRKLGIERSMLPNQATARQMLEQLIKFQFYHIEDIVYVLKYYLHFRHEFAAMPTKTLPAKSVLHVEEVILKGIETGEFNVNIVDVESMARVISHTINGYLLEYYPDVPSNRELKEIIDDIADFSVAGLTK